MPTSFYTDLTPTEGDPRAPRPALDAPFRRYALTDAQVTREGYATGLTWTQNYRPGGPWSPGCDPRRDHPDWVAYARTLERHRTLWLEAFDRGRDAAAQGREDLAHEAAANAEEDVLRTAGMRGRRPCGCSGCLSGTSCIDPYNAGGV